MSRRHRQRAIRARYSEPRPKKIANGFSALQILLFREENWRQSRSLHSHSSLLRRSCFAVRDGLADSGIGLQRKRRPTKLESGSSVTLANEADRSNILAPGFQSETFRTHLFPAFTAVRNTGILPVRQAEIFSAFLIQRSGTPLGAQTTSLCSAITTIGFVAAVYNRRREIVSSYSSATAPASHRISRADPLFQTRKELGEQ